MLREVVQRPRVAMSVVVTTLFVGVFSGAATAASPSDNAAKPIAAPTATTYTVDGRSVSMTCRGRGAVPVVFQGGGDDPGAYWDSLVAALGPGVLTCVFDRPGVAPSEASPVPLTPRSVERTLAKVLHDAHLDRRVVLVGHSIGGLNSLVFGARYPGKVAGAVLFDPSESAFFRATSSDSILRNYGYDPKAVYAQIDAVKRWPAVPLVVLSRDPARAVADGFATADLEHLWEVGAKHYARLSSKGSREVVAGATHYVHIDAPQAALDAIQGVLAKVAPAGTTRVHTESR